MWRWLLNGFGGLLGMMINNEQAGEQMTTEQFAQLDGYVSKLSELRDRNRPTTTAD